LSFFQSIASRFNRLSTGFGFDEFTRFSSVLFGPRLGVQLMTKVSALRCTCCAAAQAAQVTRLDWLADEADAEENEE
jgi:hypothetical protein